MAPLAMPRLPTDSGALLHPASPPFVPRGTLVAPIPAGAQVWAPCPSCCATTRTSHRSTRRTGARPRPQTCYPLSSMTTWTSRCAGGFGSWARACVCRVRCVWCHMHIFMRQLMYLSVHTTNARGGGASCQQSASTHPQPSSTRAARRCTCP